MKIQEIFRRVNDVLLDRISDPERIAEFPAHTEDCQKTMPLWKNLITSGAPPSWSGVAGFKIEAIEITCGECRGTTTEIFE